MNDAQSKVPRPANDRRFVDGIEPWTSRIHGLEAQQHFSGAVVQA
jgi:hypothetical protein